MFEDLDEGNLLMHVIGMIRGNLDSNIVPVIVSTVIIELHTYLSKPIHISDLQFLLMHDLRIRLVLSPYKHILIIPLNLNFKHHFKTFRHMFFLSKSKL